MKKLLTIVLLFISVAAYSKNDSWLLGYSTIPGSAGTSYYVSTTGNDSYPGTIVQPWKTWKKGFLSLNPGDILYIRGGTYTGTAFMHGNDEGANYGVFVDPTLGEGHSGTSGSHIAIMNYPGETPILDGSSLTATNRSAIGLRLNNVDYWDLTGLVIQNFKQWSDNIYASEGIYLSGAHYITQTQVVVHDCGDGNTFWDGSDHLTYTNCDSYQNWDRYIADGPQYIGGLANGFYGSIQPGGMVTYDGCRSWGNSDDGWDLYGGAGHVVIKNCWSLNNANGYGMGIHGDGCGFKIGPMADPGGYEDDNQRIMYNCLSVYNYEGSTGAGIDQNAGNVTSPNKIYNCTTYGNKINFQYWQYTQSVIKNCISAAGTNPDEFGNGNGTNTNTYNSWTGHTANSADFVSIDTIQMKGARQSNGNLPIITSFHLVSGSDMRGAGTTHYTSTDGDNVTWAALDLGAFTYVGGSGTVVLPTVTTTAISMIASTSANSGGNVTSAGNGTITDRGICYGTSANPTTSNTVIHAGTGAGSFASSLSGLTFPRTYHVRAFAINSAGTAYGADIQFDTRGFQFVVK